MWSKDKERHLINLIRERPILYDENHSQHNNSSMVGKAWLEIANSIGLSKDQVKYKWRSLKDKYKREENLLQMNIIDKSVWDHYPLMSFIKEVANVDSCTDPLASPLKENTTHNIKPVEHSKQAQPSKQLENLKEGLDMKSNKNEHSDWNFFLSLLHYTKQITSVSEKLKFRIQATNLLMEYAKEGEQYEEDEDEIQVVDFRMQKR